MSDSLPVRPPRHRGIYLLPNLFTTGAMAAGFYAIIASIGGRYGDAAVAGFIAASTLISRPVLKRQRGASQAACGFWP